MEDAQGQLVQELDNHGLMGTEPPGPLASFMDAANLEESYSNNVGYFKFPFYVLPKTVSAVPGPTLTSVQMSDVRTSRRSIAAGDPLYVETSLRSGTTPFVGSVSVNFYDGDPEAGGTLFDVEYVGYIQAQSEHPVRVPFRSSVCGKHQLCVTVGKKTPFE